MVRRSCSVAVAAVIVVVVIALYHFICYFVGAVIFAMAFVCALYAYKTFIDTK